MLISGKDVLKYAKENNVAIPAFGCVNLEGIKSIVKAAESFDCPVILQMTEGGIKYGGLEELFSIATIVSKKSKAKICIHLDHGRDLNLVKKAVDLGFNSVMYDGSYLDIGENIKNSKIIKDYIGNKDISLEVEVGTIGGKEDDVESNVSMYADINDVLTINKLVDPDSIAVAVGTAHGIYKGEININYDLIKESSINTNKPIVLHGTSGVPSDMVKKSILSGVRKVNYDTELKQIFISTINKYINDNKKEYDIRKIFSIGMDEQVKLIEQRIKECVGKE